MSKANGKLSQFKPATKNANRHNARGLKLLADAMNEVGYVAPITVAADGEALDGSARLETAFEKFGDEAIVIHHDGKKPVVMVRDDIPNADTPEAKKIAYGANRIGQIDLDWNPLQLAADLEAGLNLDGLFNPEELSAILEAAGTELLGKGNGQDPGPQEDKAKELQEKYGTALGQVWQLGQHRIACGDCTDKATVEAVMRGERAGGVFTDPPYSFGLSSTSKMAQKSGGWHDIMNNSSWFVDRYNQWKEMVIDGPMWVFCNWRTLPILMRASFDSGVGIDSVMVWYKDWIGPGGTKGLRPTYELVAFTSLGGYQIPDRGVEDFIKVGWSSHKPTGHRAEKPAELMQKLIEISPVNVVFEPFSGSGTTLIACENLNRQCRGIEIDPGYVAATLERWHQLTGKEPVLLSG